MSKAIPFLILTGFLWFSLTIGSITLDMPFENNLEDSFLGDSVTNETIGQTQFCMDSETYNQSESTDSCNDHLDTSFLKWYHFTYGFIGITGIAVSIIIFGLALRTIFWLLYVIS